MRPCPVEDADVAQTAVDILSVAVVPASKSVEAALAITFVKIGVGGLEELEMPRSEDWS